MKNIMMKKRNTKSIIILSILLILFVTIPAVCANQTSDDTTDNQDIITNNIEKPNMQTNIKKDVEENNIYASTDAQATGTGTYDDPYNITNAFNSTNYQQKDKIILKEGTYNIKKALTIAKSTANLTITSEGLVTINAINENALLDIKTDNTITIENITFTNGTQTSSNGGAIINAANLTINNCNFTANKGQSAGAIYNNKGILNVNNCYFESNQATGSGTNGYSGCIQNAQGNCTIKNSTFINNTAGSRAGVSYNNKGNLTFDTNNLIENNTGLFGGAIYNYQGTLNIINNNIFRGNYITNNYAGAIHNENGTVNIRNGNQFINNKGVVSGGVINSKGGNIVIENANQFINNTANRGAVVNTTGNITIENNNLFEDNYATYAGAALFTNGGQVIIDEANIFNNNTGDYYGGTIYLWNAKKAYINDATFNDTQANEGGTIYINTGSQFIEIYNSTFSNSTATENGGAISSKVSFTIADCEFTDCSAASGGAIYTDNSAAENQISNTQFTNINSEGETLELPSTNTLTENTYTNVSVMHEWLNLTLDADKTTFSPYEDINFTLSTLLTNPSYYDEDMLDTADIQVYLNNAVYAEFTGEHYTLSLDSGNYNTYAKSLLFNEDSDEVDFTVESNEASFTVNSVAVTNNGGNLLVLEEAVISTEVENTGSASSANITVTVDGESATTTLDDFTGVYTINTTYTPQTPGDKVVKVEMTVDDATETLYEDTITAYYNGYMGKSFTAGENFTTKREYTGFNTLILEQYNYYNWNTTSTATYDATSLEADKIVDALYYQGYNWNKYLNFKLTVNGEDAPIIANYSDTKGFASYNYPSGLVVFNITAQFKAGQTNTITPVQLENNSNILYGGILVIIYANNTNITNILINEETDLLNPEASGLTTSDYTKAYSIYDNLEVTESATLYTITAAADKADGSKIIFNDAEYGCMAENYDATSKLSIAESDITNVAEGTNNVTLQSINDNLVVLGTILVQTYKLEPNLVVSNVDVPASKGDLLVETDNKVVVSIVNDVGIMTGTVNVTVDDVVETIELEDFTGETTVNVNYKPDTIGEKSVNVEVTYENGATETLYEGTLNAYYNGYRGKSFTGGDNFTTKREYTGQNTLILEQYNYYNWNAASTATYDATSLEADKIVDALYYQGYNWDKKLNFKLTVNGEDAPLIANYSDTKGFATYNYPSGLVVFNITAQFKAGQTNTITPVQLENNSNILYGGILVIIYANNTNVTTILINEETDLLNPEASGLTTNDYTKAYSIYEDVELTPNTTLYTVTAAADKVGESKIIFNDVEYGCMADNYNNVSKLSVVESEITNAVEGTNTVTLHSTADNLVVFGTILVISKEKDPLETSITVNPVSVIVGQSVNITATITADEVVNEGKVYFKVNGKVLRDSNGRILYASVSDGSAVLEDFNNTNTWDEETSIEAVYVGNKNFTTSHSDIVNPSIIEGNESGGDTPAGPSISVESVSGSAGETVTITVNVDNVDGGKVVLKVNGKTVKAVDGKIYAKVENGVATFTYTIPKTYKTGEYSVKAVYTEGSTKLECDSTLTVA